MVASDRQTLHGTTVDVSGIRTAPGPPAKILHYQSYVPKRLPHNWLPMACHYQQSQLTLTEKPVNSS
jgi:hypothetical protein